ncbi:phage late control D family protein [Sodalis sp. dw_96]|uniref:phage late control D family protein n=1 Tax=Sodalis sp. dw_96 TaxID=2719794 RepID=UPI0021030441|nr:phage late control D family protein [Sodalis sp. dw_96]
MMLTDNRGLEADQLDIELDDADGQIQLPGRGAIIKVFLGWQGEALIGKGSFTVDEIEHRGAPDILTIRGRSADFRGSLNSRREASYHETTLGEIINQIAARNNLDPVVSDALAAIPIPHIDQTQESDAAFITRLAERNGAVAAIKMGRLMLLKPGGGRTVSGRSIPPMLIMRRDGDRHCFSIADREAYTGVAAKWLHIGSAKLHEVKVERKTKPKHLRALQHPKQKKVKSKKEAEAREGEYLTGGTENIYVMNQTYANQSAAKRAALSKWEQLQRGVAEFSLCLALGRPDLYPETPVQVTGFKSIIDRQGWLIRKVEHNLNNNGYTTNISMEVLITDLKYKID